MKSRKILLACLLLLVLTCMANLAFAVSVSTEADLDAALSSASPVTITLGADIALSGTANETPNTTGYSARIVIPQGKTVTLDLNGHTITGTPNVAKAYAVIANEGTLTIKDTSASQNGKILCNYTLTGSTGYAANAIRNSGSLTIEGGAIENIADSSKAEYQIGYAIDNNSTSYNSSITISGGKVLASGSNYYDSIRLFCNGAPNSVTVTGGEVGSIWMQNPSDSGAQKNMKDPVGSVSITGGTVSVLSLEVSSGFEVSVKGGQVGSVSYFQTDNIRELSGFITGGTFTTKPEDSYIAEGYACNAENSIKKVSKVTVTTDGNGTADASKYKALEGEEVSLTAEPTTGYQFKEWQVVSGGVTVENDKFTIGQTDVEIKAIFELAPLKVTFTVNPADAAIVVKDASGNEVSGANGVYTVPNGTYTYTVSKTGYDTKTDSIEVNGADMTVPVALNQSKYTVTFNISPIGATLVVENATPNANGTYSLTNGTYPFTVTMPGYNDVSGSVIVDGGDVEMPIDLEQTAHSVVFEVTPEDANVVVTQNGTTFAQVHENVYSLYNGEYAYTVSKDGYIAKEGTFTISGSDLAPIPVTLQEDVAIPSDTVEEAIEEAKKNNQDTVVLTPEPSVSGNDDSADISSSSIEAIAKENKAVTIHLPEGTASFDAAATKIIDQASKKEHNAKVELTVNKEADEKHLDNAQKAAVINKEVAAVVSVTLTCNNKPIKNFGGGRIEVSFAFKPAAGIDPSRYVVYHVAENGSLEKLTTRYANGRIYFYVNHLSDFVLIQEEPSLKVPQTGDNSNIALWLALMSLSAAAFVALNRRKVNG